MQASIGAAAFRLRAAGSSTAHGVSYFLSVPSVIEIRRVPRSGTLRSLVIGALLVGLGAGSALSQQTGLVVRKLDFEGNRAISSDVLAASISTTASSFFASWGGVRWIGLGEKRYLDETELQRDVLRLQVLYRRSGFLEAQIDTLARRTTQDAFVTFTIVEGRPVRVTELEIRGLDSLTEKQRKSVGEDLPLRPGQPFNRSLLQAVVDTVASRIRNFGFPTVDVFREFTADSATYSARIALNVVPGPFMKIGDVTVEGTERVDTGVVRSLLVARAGRPYSDHELITSQLNLYRSDLFDLAAVRLDTTKWNRETGTVPLQVRVSEAPPHRVRGSLGYGTNDCFRASAGYARRNFLGAGRILDVSGRVSKFGVGDPVDLGFENSICPALKDDPIGSDKLNYNLTATVRRPAFLTPQANISLSVFSERRSEFAVYLREDVGLSTSLTRESRVRRDPISLTYSFSYGRTEATPVVFCSYFSVCTPDVIALQEQRRPLATLSLRGSRPRTNNPVNPTRGNVLLGEATWSDPILGSSNFYQFVRLVGEGRWYRTLWPNVVFAWRLKGGIIFAPQTVEGAEANFVPLEQRFYAGGPNDVRGYTRNLLGPVVYTIPQAAFDSAAGNIDEIDRASTGFATGGDATVIGNIELTAPTPLFRGKLQFAVFTDVGAVWQRRTSTDLALFRATPGVGVRFLTPLGPLRGDVAYSPYRLQPGQLYIETDSTLVPATGFENYQPQQIGGFQLQISVGRAF